MFEQYSATQQKLCMIPDNCHSKSLASNKKKDSKSVSLQVYKSIQAYTATTGKKTRNDRCMHVRTINQCMQVIERLPFMQLIHHKNRFKLGQQKGTGGCSNKRPQVYTCEGFAHIKIIKKSSKRIWSTFQIHCYFPRQPHKVKSQTALLAYRNESVQKRGSLRRDFTAHAVRLLVVVQVSLEVTAVANTSNNITAYI